MWSDTGHNIKKCDSKSSYPSNATLESVLLPFIVLWTIVLLMAFDQVRTKTINSFACTHVSPFGFAVNRGPVHCNWP
ncbi:uncharacterized protein LOC117643538 isoform X3 [Thrips palmi]|uniref:Uncharacterized protein LOC117643538 isoform X3 n=1 Tax=Thrips palmi TaxID=161013 RepID=A0A6P8YNE0_THRPL|nr:uncharacterized protein LOC117643538 isoform X3 [Thrips palmi]